MDIEGLGLGSDGSSQAVESIKSLDSYEDLDIEGLGLGSDGSFKLSNRLKLATVTRIWTSKASASDPLDPFPKNSAEARRRSIRDTLTPDLRLQSFQISIELITDFALEAILSLRATRRPLEA